MPNKNQVNNQSEEAMYERKPIKVFQNVKAYNRARDRKNKRLYEEDLEEDESAIEKKRPCIF